MDRLAAIKMAQHLYSRLAAIRDILSGAVPCGLHSSNSSLTCAGYRPVRKEARVGAQ